MNLRDALILLNMDDSFGSRQVSDPGDLIRLASKLDPAPLKEELALMERHGVDLIDIFDDRYPENLKRIASPPVVLYVKGRLRDSDHDAVAMVGTRRPTYYGVTVCGRLSGDLAMRGITVVSGLARGIDTAAHKGALKAGGRTLAVLGCGLGVIYPPENLRLSEEISSCGALMSEFPMMRPPLRHNFPRRNRIISGLSLGTVVVEAAQKSGSLITANFALEENRELFAVPGRSGSKESAGTHSLLKQGAKLVDSVDDIVEEMASGLRYGGACIRAGEGSFMPPAGDECMVHGALGSEPMHFDRISAVTNIPVSRLSGLLLDMQMKRLVKELPGRCFIRN